MAKSDEADQIDEVFAEWLKQARIVRVALPPVIAAVARMPWWAQPGPTRLCSDGSATGGISWVPAIQDMDLPEGMVQRILRPTESDFKKHFLDAPFGPQKLRQERYDAAVEKLEERRQLQQVEKKTAGVDVVRKHRHDRTMALYKIESVVRKSAPSPSRLAALSLIDVSHYGYGPACFSKQGDFLKSLQMHDIGNVLRNLLPVLPDILRKTAARVIRPGGGPLCGMPIWTGGHELDALREFGRPPVTETISNEIEARAA